jgi:hypothetical protein
MAAGGKVLKTVWFWVVREIVEQGSVFSHMQLCFEYAE